MYCTITKWNLFLRHSVDTRDVVLGTSVLVLEGQVLIDIWQVLYFYFLIFKW